MKIGKIELPFRFVYVDAEGEITKRCLVSAKKSGIYIKGSQEGESTVKTYRIDRILETIDSDYEWDTSPYSPPSYDDTYFHKSTGKGLNALFAQEKKLNSQSNGSTAKNKKPTDKNYFSNWLPGKNSNSDQKKQETVFSPASDNDFIKATLPAGSDDSIEYVTITKSEYDDLLNIKDAHKGLQESIKPTRWQKIKNVFAWVGILISIIIVLAIFIGEKTPS